MFFILRDRQCFHFHIAVGLPFEIGTAVSPTFDAPGIYRSFYALFSLSPSAKLEIGITFTERNEVIIILDDDFVTARSE